LGRDLRFKFLTLVFGLTALLALSACVVASVPSATSNSAQPAETPEPADNGDEPEVTITPEPREDDSDQRIDEDDDDAVTETVEDESTDDDGIEVPTQESRQQDDRDQRDQKEADDEEESIGKPVRLQIDAIDVDAAFEYVGVDEDGNMDVPKEWENVAWYEPGTIPGDKGNAVIAGHYDSYTDPAVFFDLNELEEGDQIRIFTDKDEELTFEVIEIELVHVDEADTSKIFGPTDERNLNLITCEGVWDTEAGMYDERLILYTRLVSE
jgi:sortase A